MGEAISEVETGEITIATRSVEINGVDVHEGEVIALLDGQLVMSAKSIDKAILGLLEKPALPTANKSRCSMAITYSAAEVNRIVDLIRSAYPTHEIELHEGGQPHYQFIIAIE